MFLASWTDPIPIGGVGGAWVFPEQGVVYTETTQPAPSVDDAHALVDFFLWLDQHLTTPHPPTVVHDWRSLDSIPVEARRVFVQRRREITRRPARVVVAANLNPMLRMAIRTVSLGAQLLVHAVKLDLVDDVRPTFEALGVREPDASLHARLRLAWRHARSGGTAAAGRA